MTVRDEVKMGSMWRPEPRRRSEVAWGFRGEEGRSQDDKKSRCLVTGFCPALNIGHKKFFLVITLIVSKVPDLRERIKVSLELVRSLLDSAQNNSPAERGGSGDRHGGG